MGLTSTNSEPKRMMRGLIFFACREVDYANADVVTTRIVCYMKTFC